jgi:hypothetical protein
MSKPTGKLAHAYRTIANMEARIEALLAELDALAKDAERLEWLISNGVNVTSVGGNPIRLTRELIDAALQGEQP